MQTRNKMMDDISQLMTNAMGVAQGAVTREEFDAVRAIAQKAREENDALKARIEALEAK